MKKTFLIILAVAFIFTTVSCDTDSLMKFAKFAGYGKNNVFGIEPSMEMVDATKEKVGVLAETLKNLEGDVISLKKDDDGHLIGFDFHSDLKELAKEIKMQAGTITNPKQLDQLREQMKDPVSDEAAQKIADLFSPVNEQLSELLDVAKEGLDQVNEDYLPPDMKEEITNNLDNIVKVVQDLQTPNTEADLANVILVVGFVDSIQDMVTPLIESGNVSMDDISLVIDASNEFYNTAKALENINEPDSDVGTAVTGVMNVIDGLIQSLVNS